jgi:outer membrane protein OmpA-like peptidoglycan-associated protein
MKLAWIAAFAAASVCGVASQAAAQVRRSPILDKGSVGAMRPEVDKRYSAAVALTKSPEIVRANDTRFTWASEAKVACGIAHGFLRTNTVDEESINKCDFASQMMEAPPPPPPPPPAPPAAPVAAAPCAVKLPIIFYFDWNVATPPGEAAAVAQTTAQQMHACGWRNLTVDGHTDTSGSSAYNQKLSETRANNVAELLRGAGIAADALTVRGYGETRPAAPTPDGVREPLNRRVEVNAAAAQQ